MEQFERCWFNCMIITILQIFSVLSSFSFTFFSHTFVLAMLVSMYIISLYHSHVLFFKYITTSCCRGLIWTFSLWYYCHPNKSLLLFSFISKFASSFPPSLHPSACSYLRMTLDEGKQRLMNSQERWLVDDWGQVVEGHRLERAKDQDHMMRVCDAPLPLAQQWRHWHHRRNSKGKGQRDVLTGRPY